MRRQIQLRTATEDDIPRIEAWAQAIDVRQFMSRYLPDLSRTLLWKIVIVNGAETGAAWVEYRAELPNIVFLGIFIGQSDLLGKGIGRTVIGEVIAGVRTIAGDIAIRLNVRSTNTRAIACYRRCGFVQISSGEKAGPDGTPIPTITMQFAPAPGTGSATTHSANDNSG